MPAISTARENVSVRTGKFNDGATFHGRRSALVAVLQFDSVRDWLVFFVVDNNGKSLEVIGIRSRLIATHRMPLLPVL